MGLLGAQGEEAVHLVLAQAQQSANLAVGGAEVVVKRSGEVQLLSLGQLSDGGYPVTVADYSVHLGEHLVIGQELLVIQFFGQLAIGFNVLCECAEIVVSVTEKAHSQLYTAISRRSDVAVNHRPVSRQLRSSPPEHLTFGAQENIGVTIFEWNIIEIIPTTPPRIAERCVAGIGDIAVTVSIYNTVPYCR